MKNLYISEIALRFGLAFVFLYAGIDGLINPSDWIGYLPGFLLNLAFSGTILIAFSIYEIILGLWLISGWRLIYPALLSFVTILGIIFPNISQFSVIFRDVGLLFMTLAFIFISRARRDYE